MSDQHVEAAPAIGAVRAKMNCNVIERRISNYGGNAAYNEHVITKVILGCVYGKDGENADYSRATPSGECWMQIDQGTKAATFFQPGKRYYVTFTEAPD